MATSKLLKPTNVTISIPAGTDVPDQSVASNCLDKEADAINALSDQIARFSPTSYDTLLNSSIAVSGDSSWHSAAQATVSFTNYKYIVVTVLPHGAIGNTFVIHYDVLNAAGLDYRVSAWYDADNQGQLMFGRNGAVNVIAKTKTLAFDYIMYGFK
jgi:hypothetical protein